MNAAPFQAVSPRAAPATYRRAAEMLAVHGDIAEVEAARRGDSALEAGDVLGSTSWGRVGRALDDLRRTVPLPGDGRA